MGQSFAYAPPKLSQHALDSLCQELIDAAEFMADEQILCVADALHDTLRHRKQLRCKIHQRVEERLCAGGGAAWGRLRLLWRQRAVIQNVFTPARRAQASIANSWLTQVHLHFSVSRTELHKISKHHLSVLPGAAVQPSTASPIAVSPGPAIVTVNQTSQYHARHVATGMHWRWACFC